MGALTAAIQLITLTILGWALWVRRITWRCRWEVAVTIGIALNGAGLFLISSAGRVTLGRVVEMATGQPRLSTPLGHFCIVAATAALAYGLLSRLSTDDQLHEAFTRWVKRPAVAAALGMLAVAAMGGLGTTGFGDLTATWTQAYWALFCAVMSYLFGYSCVALWHLRRYPRHQRIANLYLSACVCGLLACIARLVWVLPMIHNTDFTRLVIYAFASLWMVGYALAASWSWHHKTQEFRNLREVVAA